ncbi:MAG: carbohydrate kinase family protein [Burkholderiaceae bacterium]
MVFDGHFKDHILPDQVHMLNVSFLTPRLKKEFGGCAANIAYNLVGLGGQATVLATIGHDADGYLGRLNKLGIDTSAVLQIGEEFTAQAFITTDLADNQIIAFHPGAMSMAHQVSALSAANAAGNAPGDCLCIVGPNGKEAMEQHAQECASAGIPFIFDPGQGLPMFDGPALQQFIEQANAVTVNDYEAKLMVERTGWSEAEISAKLEALIVTRGGEGSDIYTDGTKTTVAAISIGQAIDPTGCGDAFRGGLLFGLSQGWSWLKSTQLGSVMGGLKIEHQGPQNHAVEPAAIAERFAANYGDKPW